MAKRTTVIIKTIIEALDKPVTREEILQILIEQNPGRDRIGMANTINTYVPYRLKNDKKLNVIKNSDGKFYIQKEVVTADQSTTPDNS